MAAKAAGDKPSPNTAEEIIRFWKTPEKKGSAVVDPTTRIFAEQGKRIDLLEAQVTVLGEELKRLDALLSKTRMEGAYVQQQVEGITATVERDRGAVAEHTDQLRYLVNTKRIDGVGPSSSTVFALGSYLFRPAMHFAQGLYAALRPVVETCNSMTLFNSSLSQQIDEDKFVTYEVRKSSGGVCVVVPKSMPKRSQGAPRPSSSPKDTSSSTELVSLLRQGNFDVFP